VDAFLALLAATAFGAGTVLQQKGTLSVALPSSDPKFFRELARTPVWLAGGALQVVGWILQAAALDRGELMVVQPIVMLSLVIALPFGVWLTGQKVGRREIVAASATVLGLAVFVVVGEPAAGKETGSTEAWVVSVLVVAALVATLTLLVRNRPPGVAAVLLGSASGVLFGFQAAATKVFVRQLGNGVLALLENWSVYALVVSAVFGFLLQQSALKTGVLAPAMASTNVANMVVSVTLGALVFQETLSHGHGTFLVSIGALAVAGLGVLSLTRAETPA
jgi:drug/metabolite transporter (DMT)-like permease